MNGTDRMTVEQLARMDQRMSELDRRLSLVEKTLQAELKEIREDISSLAGRFADGLQKTERAILSQTSEQHSALAERIGKDIGKVIFDGHDREKRLREIETWSAMTKGRFGVHVAFWAGLGTVATTVVASIIIYFVLPGGLHG